MLGKYFKRIRELIIHDTFKPRNNDVFLVSYPRSGNTWVRFLLANLIAYDKNGPVDFYSVHRYIPDMQIQSHLSFLKKLDSPRVIKSHTEWDPGFRRVIYLLRDGRDVMVSYYHYLRNKGSFTGSLLDFMREDDAFPSQWTRHVSSWLDNFEGDLLLVRYEDLLANPEGELRRMADFIGLPCDKERIAFAMKYSSFKSMKRIEQEKGRPYNNAPGMDFVRKGQSGDWINYFDDKCKIIMKKYANDILYKYGYVKDDRW